MDNALSTGYAWSGGSPLGESVVRWQLGAHERAAFVALHELAHFALGAREHGGPGLARAVLPDDARRVVLVASDAG